MLDRQTLDVLLEEVREARARGDNEAAGISLRSLVEQYPQDSVLMAELCRTERELGNFERAIAFGETLVKKCPKSEMASLSLFFALFYGLKTGRATKEMLRFLAIKDSEEYRNMMKDILLDLSDIADDRTFEAVLQRLHEYDRYEEILCEVRAQLAAEAEEEKSSEP